MLQARHIAVVRFSAMGDVAMAVPVIKAVLQAYPQLHISFVSNANNAALFDGIDRCTFFAAYTNGVHKGFVGMWKLYRQLSILHRFEALADLHDVLRSKLLRFFCSFSIARSATISKGRAAKRELTSKNHKRLRQLPTSHERYAKVFEELGWPVNLAGSHFFREAQPLPPFILPLLQAGKLLVGIAPFARHREKMYPLQKMKLVVEELNARPNTQMLFFGAGGVEASELELWQQQFPGSVNVAGKVSLQQEMQLMSCLALMISMDSANMHLASVYAVPVVSIWGATHPYAGFYGWAQDEANIVQAALYCRPCSVFGNKPCFRGDHACMHLVSTEMIMQKVRLVLDKAQG